MRYKGEESSNNILLVPQHYSLSEGPIQHCSPQFFPAADSSVLLPRSINILSTAYLNLVLIQVSLTLHCNVLEIYSSTPYQTEMALQFETSHRFKYMKIHEQCTCFKLILQTCFLLFFFWQFVPLNKVSQSTKYTLH